VNLFWTKVDVCGEDDCWNWLASTNGRGYGRFRYQGIKVGAHRLARALENNKEMPKDLCVLHRCDNPRCCNPKHLSVGTRSDNMQDMVLKGRKYTTKGADNFFSKNLFPKCGEQHPQAKLTEENVLMIREAYTNGESQNSISRRLNISQMHISNICSRKRWAHI